MKASVFSNFKYQTQQTTCRHCDAAVQTWGNQPPHKDRRGCWVERNSAKRHLRDGIAPRVLGECPRTALACESGSACCDNMETKKGDAC